MNRENWWVTQGDKHILLNTARTKYACAYCGKFLGMITRQYREVEVGPNKADSRKTIQSWFETPKSCRKRACKAAKGLNR